MSALDDVVQVSEKFYKEKHFYIKSSEVENLKLLTDIATGSTAWCVDTFELYLYFKGEWIKQGI